jgi:hypothetical protein
MGVMLMREVEHRVGGVQVGPAPRPVGETGDLDGAKDRGERPVVARLYCPVADTMGIGDLFQGDLSHGAQVKVVLQQLTFELAPHGPERGLQLLMSERASFLAAQEPHQCQIDGVGSLEAVGLLRYRGGVAQLVLA